MPDWLADLIPGASPAASLPARPLEVPQALVPILTEATIRQISASTGANIILRQDTRNLGYSLVLFAGPNSAQHKARETVQQHCGLTAGPLVTRVVELHTYHSNAFIAMDEAMKDLGRKIGMVSIKLIPPDGSGAPFKVSIGPGQVAHVATAESQLRKVLREVELELHYKARRPVPPELKHAMMCKNTKDGIECPNKACPFCHTTEEIRIASRCAFENVTVSGQMSLGGISVTAHAQQTPVEKAKAIMSRQQTQASGSSGML